MQVPVFRGRVETVGGPQKETAGGARAAQGPARLTRVVRGGSQTPRRGVNAVLDGGCRAAVSLAIPCHFLISVFQAPIRGRGAAWARSGGVDVRRARGRVQRPLRVPRRAASRTGPGHADAQSAAGAPSPCSSDRLPPRPSGPHPRICCRVEPRRATAGEGLTPFRLCHCRPRAGLSSLRVWEEPRGAGGPGWCAARAARRVYDMNAASCAAHVTAGRGRQVPRRCMGTACQAPPARGEADGFMVVSLSLQPDPLLRGGHPAGGSGVA